jgi:hypothetical protein
MQKWEYLVVHIWEVYWGDSDGRQGKLPKLKLPHMGDWFNSGPLLSDLGSQGWELVSATSGLVYTTEIKLYLKRPKP